MTWTKEAYFSKATVMWEKATDHPRESIDYFLNFSFFIEYAVRGALVSRNPALNASRDDESLLFSAGADARLPKTVELSKALAYIKRLLPEVTDPETTAIGVIIDFRNVELHDDRSDFDKDVLQRIIPDCQMFVSRMLDFAEVAPEDVLGKEDAKRFQAVREAKQGDRNRRVRGLIDTAKDRFFHLPEAEQQRLKEENAPKFLAAVMTSGRHLKPHRCPSCAGSGILAGQPYGSSSPMLVNDDLKVEVRVIPDGFECKICSLTLRGLDEILATNLPNEFTSIDSVDIVEHFGIDPMDYIDAEDVAREYNSNNYEYQDE